MSSSSWKHALFTTYTLSLGYFESEVLHPLLRTGCDDIWLVADAEGYRASLLERRSMRVGQEYRLIPAALPDGVFHAKCIYLSGDEEDLLLVGSGNVTFGGHGKNAEVFEALSPDGAASAFEDFSAFLESLGSRPDLHLPRTDWIEEFAARARTAATRGSNGSGPPVRLVHSLNVPIERQLADLLKPYGPPLHATIMSPYHDPDGLAVRQLIKRVRLPAASVVVTENESSPFPFSDTKSWEVPITAVRWRAPEKRFVHAKWFEFAFENNRILLTGSMNATRKALTTTDNVEVGVLRHLPSTDPALDCVLREAPRFEPNDRMPSGLGEREIVFASFDRAEADRLHGQVVTYKPAAGFWQVRLVQADGESVSSETRVDDAGRFVLRAKEIEAFSQLPAVQIIMTLDARSARGWVHNEMLLGVRARRRLTAGVLSRLMRREGTDDDIQALLDYLSVQAEHHLRLFSQPIRVQGAKGAGAEGTERTISVNIEELAPAREIEHTPGLPRLAAPTSDDQFNRAMSRLRRMLLGHGRERRQSRESGSTTALAEEDLAQGRERTPDEVAHVLGLRDFEISIEDMIVQAGDRPAVRNGLLAMLLEVSMSMRLYRLDDRDGAHEFMNGWFFKACRLSQVDLSMSTSLQQHLVTAAATLFALSPAGDARAVLATSVHDALEKFYRGPVDEEHALRSLISDPETGFAAALAAGTAEIDLPGALRQILATRTRRRQLEDALALAEMAEAVPADWSVFQSKLGKALWETLQRPDWQKRVRRALPGVNACAFDYYAFAVREAAQFERERIGRCIQCERYTVNTMP